MPKPGMSKVLSALFQRCKNAVVGAAAFQGARGAPQIKRVPAAQPFSAARKGSF
jgi:hypothetical protein